MHRYGRHQPGRARRARAILSPCSSWLSAISCSRPASRRRPAIVLPSGADGGRAHAAAAPRRRRCRYCSPAPTPKRASKTPRFARPATISTRAAREGRSAALGRRRASDRIGRRLRLFQFAKGLGGDWTFEKLDHWIADPKAMASGTKMAFAGETDPQKDADILAYLQTLSDRPVPFPKPDAAPANGARTRRDRNGIPQSGRCVACANTACVSHCDAL